MSILSKLWSFNQQFIFGLCAASMLYNPAQVFAQDYDDNYAVEQSSGYSQPVLLGGAAVLGAAAGAITAACMNHHGHRGNRGSRGPQGIPGTNGTIGGVGATGATGPAGPAGADPFIADPDPAATFTVDFNFGENPTVDPGITFTTFIIYPDGTVQDGLTGPLVTSLTTATPLVYGSYTIGLRVYVPDATLTASGVLTPLVTSSATGSVYQLPSFLVTIPGAQPSPGYMYTAQYEYPNPATPFILP